MQPQLAPVAHVPIETLPSGAVHNPELTISTLQGSPVLYVRQPVLLLNDWDRVLWYGPEIGSILVGAAAIWAVWVIRRVMHRPRGRGRVYCGSCNYEQVPPAVERVERGMVWASESSRCSECGRRQKLVVGRSRWWRLGVPLVICGGMLIGGGILLRATLAPPEPWFSVPWPSAWVARQMGTWELARREREWPGGHKVTRWELPSGKPVGTLCTERVRGMRNSMLSPDGRTLVMLTEERDPLCLSMMIIDTETGAKWESRGAIGSYTQRDLVGFSRDSKVVYVQRWRSVNAEVQELALESWNVESRNVTQIARVDVPYHNTTASSPEASFARFLVDERGHWVLAAMSRTAAAMSSVADITAFDGIAEHKYSIPLPSNNWYEPRLAESGMLELPLTGGTAGVSVDLATGAFSVVAMSPLPPLRSQDGRLQIRTAAPGAVVVGRDGTTLAKLVHPASTTVGWTPGAISKDGRWYSAMVMWLKPGAKAGSASPWDYAAEVLVWDLSGVP